jgi:hypothetical protein
MCTQNTHEVDPFDSIMVQGSLLQILACTQNPREYRPIEVLSVLASLAKMRERVCPVFTPCYNSLHYVASLTEESLFLR